MAGYIGLGSNLGDRWANLLAGLSGLDQVGLSVLAASSVWETEPVASPTPDWFLNMVVRVRTEPFSPLQVLDLLLAIERKIGRVRTVPNAPRTLDLDLLLIDGLTWSDERLVLPHPRMRERRFVLDPLAEIGPDLLDPATGGRLFGEGRTLEGGPLVIRVGPLLPT